MQQCLSGEHGPLDETEINDALLRASNHGHIRIVRALLDKGADPNYSDHDGDTPILLATRNKCFEVARLLINHNAEVNVQNDLGHTPLHMAAWTCHLKMTQLMLDWGTKWSVADCYGQTALMIAAKRGDSEVVKLMVDHGCDVHQQNHENETALHYAAKRGHSSCARVLLEAGADINAESMFGYTPIMAALSAGFSSCVLTLMEEGAAIDKAIRPGNSLLNLCLRSSGENTMLVLQRLLEAGLDPNCADSEGNTILCDAICQNQIQHVKVLIQGNCDVNQMGRTAIKRTLRKCAPFEIALDRGFVEIAKILIIAGSDTSITREWVIDPDALPLHILRNTALFEMLHAAAHAPKSLMEYARLKIRHSLSTGIRGKIPRLPIPRVLQSYIALEELERLF